MNRLGLGLNCLGLGLAYYDIIQLMTSSRRARFWRKHLALVTWTEKAGCGTPWAPLGDTLQAGGDVGQAGRKPVKQCKSNGVAFWCSVAGPSTRHRTALHVLNKQRRQSL